MAKISSNSRECAQAIGERETFETYGALRATSERVGSRDSGWLEGTDLERFKADASNITYTVFSYDTPIAWVANGLVYRVGQKFSVTTSKHQGKTYLLADDAK